MQQVQKLLTELSAFPQSWTLTPTNGNKRSYRKGWQTEPPLSREQIALEITSGKAQGVGLRAGQNSGGILCIDFDGHSALDKWLELSGNTEPPLTVGWTSGKPGRWQLALLVPLEQWDEIATKKIPTAWDDKGKPTEYLEIRWDGCQSVLPGSVHPQTGSYNWLPGQSPAEVEIAPIPDWVLEVAKAEQKYQPRENIATNPTLDPWDIRNFAHLLDSYRPDGRRGWDTCKCPAHNGNSDNSLHIEQSSGAFKCHAGCDPKDVYHAALELAQSHGYTLPEKRSPRRFSDLFGWLPRLKRHLEKQRQTPWGFGRKGEVEVESEAPQQKTIKYGEGDRINVWSALNHLGVRHVLDISDTGTGKSYNAGRLTPEDFADAQGMFYVSKEHRNPPKGTPLESWPDVESRHDGLHRDEFGKLRRVDKGQPYVVPPNCGRNRTIGALRAKNIPGADTADLVCHTCPHLEPCRAGATYDYLHQRAANLAETRRSIHPDSMPDPGEFDYSREVVVWEEAGDIFKAHRSIEVKADDVFRTIADLCAKLPETFDALRPLLTQLHLYASDPTRQPNKFGWGDAQLRQDLPNVDNLNLEAIRDALKPQPERFLNTTKEHGVDSSDLPRNLRKKFTERDSTTAEQITKELALYWLPDFLEVLLGNTEGTLRIQYGVLTISMGNDRYKRIAQAASFNIYLDATAREEDIARAVGLDLDQLIVAQQAVQAPKNVEVIQVATIGRLGLSQRSEFCQDRVDAVIAQVQKEATGDVAVFDFKKHTQSGDGKRHWWVDSRGINDLETCQTLILTGTPCENLGALEAEFTALYGRRPREGTERVRYAVQLIGQPSPDLQPYFEMEVSADLEFREFVRRKILATYRQAVGRLRAHRRAGENLKVVIIADYPLDFPVRLVKASQITPEAATKMERFEMALKAGIQQLRGAGQKITQTALAAITGYQQQYISRFKELLLSLIDSSKSKSSKNNQPPPDPGETEFMAKEYLPLLAGSPPAELLEGVLNTFEAYGRTVFKDIWDVTPATAQIKILSVLALTLPAGELRALCLALGVAF